MRDNGKTTIFQGIHRRQILLISETAPDLPQRIVVNGLQTKFYPDRFLAEREGAVAKSPLPPALQKIQPRESSVPSRFGQVIPPFKDRR